MNEEIQVRKAQSPPKLYLYSAFYISCLCDPKVQQGDLTPPRASSAPTPVSPASQTSEENEALRAMTVRKVTELQRQVGTLQGKVDFTREKNAELLHQVNQLLQEKLVDQRQITELQVQNADLKLQLTELRQDHSRMQAEGMARSPPKPTMVEKSCNTMDSNPPGPSTATTPLPIAETSVPNKALSVDVCTRLWDIESRIALNFNLHQLYEIQRDLMLTMVGLELREVMDREKFKGLWEFCSKFKVENLLVEILARKHLKLSDPFHAFVVMGDIGGRIFLYYAGCEEKLLQRRGLRRQIEERVVDWTDYSTVIYQQFYHPERQIIAQWRASLEVVLPLVRHEDYFTMVLTCSLKRVYNSDKLDDFTATHYVYNREKAIDRIEKYLKAIDGKKAPVLAVEAQVEFSMAPPGYCPRYVPFIAMPVGGSTANQRYLGNYRELFDAEGEQPVPTWPALGWILEDYGLSRTETVAADLVYKRTSGAWSFEPPPAVQLHPQFCPCPRRHKWAPDSTIASVEYNWPQIQGAPGFNSPGQCKVAYMRYFEEHRTHKDPVCFRAAVFCAALGEWCHRWNFAINVNCHQKSRQEFLMLLKLQYRPSRWVRLVEAMAMTHFIEGVHPSLINEFPCTRAGPFERFLKWQRQNNPEGVAQDEDLQRALLRLDGKDAKQRP